MILALDCLRLQQEGGEVLRREGMAHLAHHLAAAFSTTAVGVALERMAEGVVGGEEEPGVAAGLDDGLAGAVGKRPGVVGPVDGVGACSALPVRSEEAAPDTRNTLFFSLVMVLTASATEEVGHVDDHVDLVDVEPLAHDVGADVGLVLVVGEHDLDLVVALVALQKSSTAFFAAHTEPCPERSE